MVRDRRAGLSRAWGLDAAQFFVLRTPLLPLDAFLRWSESQNPVESLDAAWRQPPVREAVFVATPELDAALERAHNASATSEATVRARRSLVAYFTRMCSRSTPFGLFAGCSVGTPGPHTSLELAPAERYQRHTRLDMDYLSALTRALEADTGVRNSLRYSPNSSLYQAGGRLHYVESRLGTHGRSYHLVAVEASPELDATLTNARDGAPLDALAEALVTDTVTLEEARAFLEELADNQVLVSDLDLDVTGREAIHSLIARLEAQPATRPTAERLAEVRQALDLMDAAGVGGNPRQAYTAVQGSLEQLPSPPDLARLFQVDLVKPPHQLTLGPAIVSELQRGIAVLHRLAPATSGDDALTVFAQRFTDRYEGAEVPLVEALDEEIGVGFAASTEPGGEPLLAALDRPAAPARPGTFLPQHGALLQLLSEALARGSTEVALDSADIDALAGEREPPPLPDALAVVVRLAAVSAAHVDRGEFRLFLQSGNGPPGARLLGRFCHADPLLADQVLAHLRAEEAHRPDALFAEIVHLPEGRIGNILSRPVLRAYEIPYLGHSGAAAEYQIPVTDLRVSVRNGRVVLRSVRLNREILPRLTTAHNYSWRSLGVYRFLCALQNQHLTPAIGWSWGPLEWAPFLPRVVSGRLVLARARWILTEAEIGRLTSAPEAVQALRAARRLPRLVVLADSDNELLVDLDNPLSVEAFVHLVKGRERVRLEELFPPADELCVRGPEGRFCHEMIVPFVKTVNAPVAASPTPVKTVAVQRAFPPGSEWLYAKLYTGQAIADRLLAEVVHPLVRSAFEAGLADQWFFIRYADPDPHVRLRLHGDPLALIPLLNAAFGPLLADGRLARWQVDTYVREVERYGGDVGIRLAEQLFHVDSDCALEVLLSAPGDVGLTWRWKLALCGVDMLLDALGLDLLQKRDWARLRRDAFAAEFRVASRTRQQLGELFRAERSGLMDLLRLAASPSEYPALQALQRRTERLAPWVEELHAREHDGELTVAVFDLAASYAHMHVNRMLRSEHRFQELAIYDLLDRLYRAQVART